MPILGGKEAPPVGSYRKGSWRFEGSLSSSIISFPILEAKPIERGKQRIIQWWAVLARVDEEINNYIFSALDLTSCQVDSPSEYNLMELPRRLLDLAVVQ